MPCVDRTPSKGGKALWSIFRYGVGTEPESESAAAFHSVSLAFSIVCLFVLSTFFSQCRIGPFRLAGVYVHRLAFR
jgi:hypothetical protein